MIRLKYLIIFLAALLLNACSLSRYSLQNGDPDSAISVAIIKLKQNPNLTKEALTLEEAYFQAFKRDTSRVHYLKSSGDPECWVELYEVYSKIDDRQQKVAPILPLFIRKEYRNAQIPLLDIAAEKEESRKRAAEYKYALAESFFRQNNKQAYRKAYEEYSKIITYYQVFRDVDDKKSICLDKGRVNVLFSTSANPNLNMPSDLRSQLNSYNLNGYNSLWTKYFNASNAPSDLKPDYLLELRYLDVQIMPEQIQSRTYSEQKTIQDGWTYQLDSRGQVQKDSNGNDIKRPKMIQIHCEIREVQQAKDAFLNAEILVRGNSGGQVISTLPIRENIGFRNLYANASGDLRALSDPSRQKINTLPMPFPPNAQMSTDLVRQSLGKLPSLISQLQSYFRP